jgi:hypothetical protein
MKISLTIWPVYSQGESFQYPLLRWTFVPHSRSLSCTEKSVLFCSVRNPVQNRTEQNREQKNLLSLSERELLKDQYPSSEGDKRFFCSVQDSVLNPVQNRKISFPFLNSNTDPSTIPPVEVASSNEPTWLFLSTRKYDDYNDCLQFILTKHP